MKIQIIGYSGSGKSTLAKKLGAFFNIPVLHLDNTRFYGDWQERTDEEQSAIVQSFLDKNESWVIDGNFARICPKRFEISDITIYLNFNRFICFISAFKRARQYKNVHRDSCPCNEKFDHEFRKWLLFDGRTKERRKKNLINLNKTKGKKFILKNRKQVTRFLEKIKLEYTKE